VTLNRRNYQKELDSIIEKNIAAAAVPTLLLHSCCAPCSSYVLEYLSRYFAITDFYYNPNISPSTEYEYREEELDRLIREMPVSHPVTFLRGKYEPERYYAAVKGYEDAPEGGERCEICFRLRLEEAAKKAKELGLDYFATTLTISPMKDPVLLNQIGEEMAEKYGVKYLPSEFRKRNGYKRSTELSREYGLYRQNFCGCVFSRMEAEKRDEARKNTEADQKMPENEEAADRKRF
jgi:predicted adenine nucleotide alpha hydrolase (AANH) superfamily ATPase